MARRDGVESKYHLTTGSKHNISAMESKTTQLLYETLMHVQYSTTQHADILRVPKKLTAEIFLSFGNIPRQGDFHK